LFATTIVVKSDKLSEILQDDGYHSELEIAEQEDRRRLYELKMKDYADQLHQEVIECQEKAALVHNNYTLH